MLIAFLFSVAITWFPLGEFEFSLPSKMVNAITKICMLRLTFVPSLVILTATYGSSLMFGIFLTRFSSLTVNHCLGEFEFSLPSKMVNAITKICMLRLTFVPSPVILTATYGSSLMFGNFLTRFSSLTVNHCFSDC